MSRPLHPVPSRTRRPFTPIGVGLIEPSSNFGDLPEELLLRIFQNVPDTAYSLRRVSTSFHGPASEVFRHRVRTALQSSPQISESLFRAYFNRPPVRFAVFDWGTTNSEIELFVRENISRVEYITIRTGVSYAGVTSNNAGYGSFPITDEEGFTNRYIAGGAHPITDFDLLTQYRLFSQVEHPIIAKRRVILFLTKRYEEYQNKVIGKTARLVHVINMYVFLSVNRYLLTGAPSSLSEFRDLVTYNPVMGGSGSDQIRYTYFAKKNMEYYQEVLQLLRQLP